MSIANLFKNRLSRSSRTFLIITFVVLLIIGVAGYGIMRAIKSTIEHVKEEHALIVQIEVTSTVGNRLSLEGSQLSLSINSPRAICQFRDRLYVATAGGLLAYDKAGKMLNHYTNFDGLPSLDLTSLAVFRDRLYIGTADQGLSSFDGNEFTNYQFRKPALKAIGALFSGDTELLIGSFETGLFRFNGSQFTRFDTEKAPISQITTILIRNGRYYIGTYAQGLYVWQEGRWQQWDKNGKLPSNRITALLVDENNIIIATDFGTMKLTDNNDLQLLNRIPNITTLARARGQIWCGLFTGGYFELPVDARSVAPLTDEAWKERSNTQLWADTEGTLYALTNKGIFRAEASRARLEFEPFGEKDGLSPLAAAHISTMAFDQAGRLWVGYFDHGIDIFEPDNMELITHLEDEKLREINFICADSNQTRMLVATSAGLAIFADNFRYRLLDENAGITSNAVSHVALFAEEDQPAPTLAIATGKGLTMLQGAIARTPISLPNNYLYTSAPMGNRLFVGSLGGLIEIDHLRAVRTFTIANSKLSHNWINALTAINGTLYIGTNGGGVDALLPSGEVVNYAPQIGKFDVNANAMYHDDKRLFVGSLNNGLLIFDLNTRQWQKLTRGLPSLNVSALLGNNRYIYIGTNNGLLRLNRDKLAE